MFARTKYRNDSLWNDNMLVVLGVEAGERLTRREVERTEIRYGDFFSFDKCL